MADRGPGQPSGRQQAVELFQAGQIDQALALAREASAADPKDSETLNLLAVINGQLDNYEQVIEFASRSLDINAGQANTWLNLGIARMHLEQIDDARSSLARALSINPDLPAAHFYLAQVYLQCDEPKSAINELQQVLRLAPESTEALGLLGEQYEMQNRIDDARIFAERALAVSPEDPLANYVLAKVERRNNDLHSASDRLRRALSQPLDSKHVAMIWNERARVLDGLEEYDDAYLACVHSQQAAVEAYGQQEFCQQSIFETIDGYRRSVTHEVVSGWEQYVPEDGLPDPCFLVAFPRSGTTLTEQILGSHSNVITSDERPLLQEVIRAILAATSDADSYPDNLSDLNTDELHRLRRYYWESAEKTLGSEVRSYLLLDKLPLNIIHAALIYRLFPTAPILFVLRDPRDVCLSGFMQLFSPNDAMMNFTDIASTARLYAEVMASWNYFRGILPMRIFSLRYEDMVADTESWARQLLDFLGLPWESDVLDYYRSGRQVSTPSYEAVSSPIYSRSVGRWKYYARHMQNALTILDPCVRQFGYD